VIKVASIDKIATGGSRRHRPESKSALLAFIYSLTEQESPAIAGNPRDVSVPRLQYE